MPSWMAVEMPFPAKTRRVNAGKLLPFKHPGKDLLELGQDHIS